MRFCKLSSIILAVAVVCYAVVAQAVTIETVPIGNAGNAADTSGYGAVGYNYNIGKYEVTAGQYTAFLNAKANVSDTYGLYNSNMWNDTYSGCMIQQTSIPGGYTYSVAADYANRPVNYVSYWDSLRFANWLGNDQGTGDTETGAYTLTSAGIGNNTIARNTDWKWAVTSEDEWYKAAYYKGGDLYSLYANGTSTAPVAGTTGSNYNWAIGSTWDGTINGALEQNGTKDMMGNVWEWNESIVYSSSRGLRGGDWGDYSDYLAASHRDDSYPAYGGSVVGFRVASVPEPGSITLLVCGAIACLMWWRRHK
jgi:formylglycine-generating enzyme required for sulfatase activity